MKLPYGKSLRDFVAKSAPGAMEQALACLAGAVCGLHVPWNLEVIKAYKNRAKSNSFEVA